MPDLLAALTAWLDNRKKVGGQNIQELINDPQALISRLGQQTGEDLTKYAKDQLYNSQALRSVMPEVREQAGNELANSAMGMGGITAHRGAQNWYDPFNIEKIGTGKGVYRTAPVGEKVDIPDETVDKMLHWDKPLTQQSPQVIKALQDGGVLGDLTHADRWANGETLWNHMASTTRSDGLGPQGAAQALNNMGIPGIRYSTTKPFHDTKKTHSFVMFDEALPTKMGREASELDAAMKAVRAIREAMGK